MRIVRVITTDGLMYGLVKDEGIILCLGDPINGLEPTDSALDLKSAPLTAPIDPPNIICVGLNYKRHAAEGNHAIPDKPLLFMKPTTTLAGPTDSIHLPRHNPDRIDVEAELALVIGKTAKDVPIDQAREYILGWTVGNDVSNKAAQRLDGQWVRGKSYDGFCPLGPVLTDEGDPDNLNITCRIDGEIRQSSNTSDMIFSCDFLVSYISECMTLLPGTVIMTGTPEGLGCWRNPPLFLEEGQLVEIEIEGIGKLSNRVKI